MVAPGLKTHQIWVQRWPFARLRISNFKFQIENEKNRSEWRRAPIFHLKFEIFSSGHTQRGISPQAVRGPRARPDARSDFVLRALPRRHRPAAHPHAAARRDRREPGPQTVR